MSKKMSAESLNAVLPWYAAGTLGTHEASQVEAALVVDAGLARRLDVVREEMTETILLNEALGAPSARARDTFFEAIQLQAHHGRKLAAHLRYYCSKH
jgi:hypothetical protein